ncbi:MAG TPA: flagellar hook-basal body complex protein [Buchnera sp. (in: enterobacteria)]|nr:flagellar hook-basal body complex protein [Buchnera sp. (in: enterobacteria)]
MNTAMISASHTLDKQAITANNLANISTLGFKQQLTAQLLLPVSNKKILSNNKKFISYNHIYSDLSPGPILYTKRPLDISIPGNGWLTVQDNTAKNKEAYTKTGHLQINKNRKLVINNHMVLSTKGPITVPITGTINISSHGIINFLNKKNHEVNGTYIGKLKLINIADKDIEKGNNGFFYINKTGLENPEKILSKNIKILSGTLEDSNVNLSENLINMISYERQFAIEMQLIANDDENTKIANQLMHDNNIF